MVRPIPLPLPPAEVRSRALPPRVRILHASPAPLLPRELLFSLTAAGSRHESTLWSPLSRRPAEFCPRKRECLAPAVPLRVLPFERPRRSSAPAHWHRENRSGSSYQRN